MESYPGIKAEYPVISDHYSFHFLADATIFSEIQINEL